MPRSLRLEFPGAIYHVTTVSHEWIAEKLSMRSTLAELGIPEEKS